MIRNYKTDFRECNQLGSGGFSTVFKAVALADEKPYAIKKIPFNKADDEEKTLKEIQFLRSLNRQFVVTYLDSWIEQNYYIGGTTDYVKPRRAFGGIENLLYDSRKTHLLHIQMEMCSQTLSDFIKNLNYTERNVITPDSYGKVCAIFIQLLECVKYLHEQQPPIIHRDLKPENILLLNEESGVKVKLTDFGLSTYHHYVDESHTKYIGTTSYRAPEINFGDYNTKADIYSVGIIMHQLFNLNPHSDSNKNDFSIQTKFANAKNICLKCVETDPKKRPSCEQILSDKYLWNYDTNEDLLSPKINKDFKTLAQECGDKWPLLSEIPSTIVDKCTKLAIIEEIEEKAIFNTENEAFYALRVSSHIDDEPQEPKIIKDLSDRGIESIVWGKSHVLCLTNSGEVYSFGTNEFGQLGNGSDKEDNTPKIVAKLSGKNIIVIKCGEYHCVALSATGKVYIWGNGFYDPSNFTPIELSAASLGSEKISSISCGEYHCLALTETGKLYSWGENEYGQLGEVDNPGANPNAPKLVSFVDSISIAKICCGPNHNLILTADSDIYAFGNNVCGQLGIGDTANVRYTNKMTKTKTSVKFSDIAATPYGNISVGLSADREYYVWGDCIDGQRNTPTRTTLESLGDIFAQYSINSDTMFETIFREELKYKRDDIFDFLNKWHSFDNTDRDLKLKIKSLSVVRLKESKALLLTNDDCVYAFRLNKSIDNSSKEPIIVKELSNRRIKRIVCGYNHVLCLTETKEVYSFGYNDFGQLGNGSTINSYTPAIISALSHKNIVNISSGSFHCLALSETGEVYAWGYGAYGQVGNNIKSTERSPIMLRSFGANKISQIACGSNHCLALAVNGNLYGWGYNKHGQLGDRNNTNQNKPILIAKSGDDMAIIIKKITCGPNHSLLLTNEFEVYAFGKNDYGQLGIGTTDNRNEMIRIECSVKFVDIHTTFCDNISAGLSQSGEYYIWGKCDAHVITTPVATTKLDSFDEIFAKYSKKQFTAEHIDLK